MKNSDVVGKYIIIKDLNFNNYMKDEYGKIRIYDTLEDASNICGIYEFDDVLIVKIEYNHIDLN